MHDNHGPTACHLCGAAAVRTLPEFRLLPRVSSDLKPVPAGGELGVCPRCGAVQKPITPAWRADADAIYRAYTLYHNAGGAEQVVFASGAPDARSARVVRRVREKVALPAAGRMLDVGCGNGAMLRAFGGQLPGWALVGNEITDARRAEVEAIPGVEKLYPGRPEDVPGSYDVITLAHVLEHIPDPVPFLRALAGKLTAGGLLVVEVPDHRNNPFDLAVADHCTHYTPDSLGAVAAAAGLEVVALADDVVPRELTAVVRPGAAGGAVPAAAAVTPVRETVAGHLRWLAALADQAKGLGDRIGVFGTSVGAAWALGVAGERVRFFLDEDPAKVGQVWAGRPILRPADAPPGLPVLVGLPPQLAADIKTRLGTVIGADRLHFPTPAGELRTRSQAA